MTLLTFVQVVLRYVFNTGLIWALEATTYLFAWLVLFGMSYGVRVGSHIGIDAVVKLMGPRGQRIAGFAAAVLSIVYAVILLIGSINYIDSLHTMGVEAEDIPVERWILGIILPIGFALLGIRLAEAAWRILRGEQRTLQVGDEGTEALKAHEAELAAHKDARQ